MRNVKRIVHVPRGTFQATKEEETLQLHFRVRGRGKIRCRACSNHYQTTNRGSQLNGSARIASFGASPMTRPAP